MGSSRGIEEGRKNIRQKGCTVLSLTENTLCVGRTPEGHVIQTDGSVVSMLRYSLLIGQPVFFLLARAHRPGHILQAP